MKTRLIFIFCILALHNDALADISKGTIEGYEWAKFSDDTKYGLIVGYVLGAKMEGVTAKELYERVEAYFKNPSGRNMILEDAIGFAYRMTKIMDPRSQAHSTPAISSPPNTRTVESILSDPIQDSPHWKAGGSAYKDYTLPQNQPIPQPSYQQQQWNNGNGFGRYGNYPNYPR